MGAGMSDPRFKWIYILNRIHTSRASRRSAWAGFISRAHGHGENQPDASRGHQCTAAIIVACTPRASRLFGWGLNYAVANPADDPVARGAAMAFGLDGYVVDIETEAEVPGSAGPVGARPLAGLRPARALRLPRLHLAPAHRSSIPPCRGRR